MNQFKRTFTLILFSLLSSSVLFAQTGKISGTIKDARTGDPLIAANVVVEGTMLGAASDFDGYFVILGVPPGMHSLRVSMLGYAPRRVLDVRISIDLTTNLEVELSETVIEGEEIIVVAERPVVKPDLAASTANISIAEVENLPVTQVSSIVSLQAGVQGLTIRGGGSDQTDFVLNGLSLRDERNNTPYTAISLLAVEEIQIQTGGFNAEYGNIRSGLANIVTREGGQNEYTFGIFARYSPPGKKYFGHPPNHPNSYWVRPFIDDAVAWDGTKGGAWDPWTQRQYVDFEGWNSLSQKLLSDDDPTNDLSPQAAQKVWLWQHRKVFDVTKPDYDVDFGFGGPFPFISEVAGNLRFFASGRMTVNQYAIPFGGQWFEDRNRVLDYSYNLKFTSDIAEGMKLMVEGLIGRNEAMDQNRSGVYGIFTSPGDIGSSMNRVSYIDTRLFTTDYWSPSYVNRELIGAKFTHLLTSETFYDIRVQRFHSKYDTNPGRLRDTTRQYLFGDAYYLDEAPVGFFGNPPSWSTNGIDGKLRLGIGFSNARDSSEVTRYQMNFDLVSQIDRYNQIKGGFEIVYTENFVNYASVDEVLQSGRSQSAWQTYPTRYAIYLQDKLEYEGMIANLGLRFEASDPGGEWYAYDPYTREFFGTSSLGIDTTLQKAPTKVTTTISPRLGVAFPITENAKLFFNYGHFRSMPSPENLYLIRRDAASKSLLRLADPNLPLPKTVAYELGFEQNLWDQFLLRVAGYYKDVSDQSRLVSYVGFDNKPNYSVTTNTSYEDIRGFELTLTKNRGQWVQGFINYTYMVETSGAFGWGTQYQNPVDQRDYERTNPQQFKPIPQPYARANIDFFTPYDFGPDLSGIYPLGSWRLNLLGTWSEGYYFTWVGGGSRPGVIYNAQWKDSWGFDMRLSKSFSIAGIDLQFFMDIQNALNFKYLTSYGFVDGADYEAYMKSLHLPKEFSEFYGNIVGDDQPGEYRPSGIEYQPMVHTFSLTEVGTPHVRPIYYEEATNKYYQWRNGAWVDADPTFVQTTLDNRAYIDMPNQDWFNFVNPRNIYFGMRLSFKL